MATHDYVIANGTGAAVRSDLNGALAAIVSQNSSATEPSPSYAYQRWADTTAGVMKMRNGANNAWISLYELDGTFLAGDISLSAGAAATPSLFFTGDTNTGIYSPGADQVGISTGGTARITVDASGNVNIDSNTLYVDAANNRVGVGTSSPGYLLDIQSTSATLRIRNTTAPTTGGTSSLLFEGLNDFSGVSQSYINSIQAGNSGVTQLAFGTSQSADATATERLRIGSAGTLEIKAAASTAPFIANIGVGEAARIDSSGRLLVGTSTTGSVLTKTIELHGAGDGTSQPAYQIYAYPGTPDASTGYFDFLRSASSTLGTNTLVGIDDRLGMVRFSGADGSTYVNAASIYAEVDGTPGASDMPGRLVFSTTADGAASPTERMRIDSQGRLMVVATSFTDAINGFLVGGGGQIYATTTSTACASFNRLTDDGELLVFKQANTQEGSISVSGTTVSYNGAHLSRWSQLSSGAERTEILRGSVLSNINEMCEWPDEDNEQLNRMKVSDVEGDKNVSGVFQAWDDDDDTYTDDFYCAMTGDFIIRIAEGVTVERGDLLMSAGDGTAKPQDDDIIRSKTIAKVTSTNVSCTYEDGSYCVPCVLMAC